MLEPEHLNPNDVLAHLEALGFQNVTPRQLKDFIHDLKKLIKYEQKHLQRDCQNLEAGDFECSCRRSDDNCDEQLSNDICSSSDISDCTSTTYKNCKNEKLVNESKFKSGATENYLFKTQSSFIRPRSNSALKSASFKDRKNLDPVKLYHHYKEFWNRQKIPGESNHSHLRWIIRNKMLGHHSQHQVI